MEDLTKTAAYVCRLTTPSRLENEPVETFGTEPRTTACLYTSRGERFLPNTDLDRRIENEAFIMDVGLFIDQKASKKAKKKFGNIIEDIHTEPPSTNVCKRSAYDMGDLSFNLTPYRVSFIEPYRATSSSSLFEELKTLLDERCSNGDGCYYLTHAFPHVDVAGPVAMCAYVGLLITEILPASTNANEVEELLETLAKTLRCDRADTSVGRVANKCIVCTLVNAATQRIRHSGAVIENDPSDLFLINTKSASDLGFRSLPNIDYSQDVINIHETESTQLDQVLAINQKYAIENIIGVWTVIRLDDENELDFPFTDGAPTIEVLNDDIVSIKKQEDFDSFIASL